MVNHKKEVTKESICLFLHLPISKAAEALNISTSVLKKRCRSFGISNWPYRKIRSVDKKIARLRKLLETSPEYSPEITSEIARYTAKRARVIEHPELVKLSSHISVKRSKKQTPSAVPSLPLPPLPFGTLSQQSLLPQPQMALPLGSNLGATETIEESPKLNLPPLEGIASVLCSLSSASPPSQYHEEPLHVVSEAGKADDDGNSSGSDVKLEGTECDTFLPPCSSFDLAPPFSVPL